jgi:hypothetical protein
MEIFLVGLTLILSFGTARLLQPPLAALLYGNQTLLHLFQPNCADLLSSCADRDRILVGDLSQGFPVGQWSPDGAFIAVYTYDGWLIYRADCLLTNENCQPAMLDPTATDPRLAWGPDGSAVAYISIPDFNLRIRTRGCWDGSPPDQCVERTVQLSGQALRYPDWSADGSRIAFMSENNDIYTLELACMDTAEGCANQVRLMASELLAEYWPSLSADGTMVLYEAGASNIPAQIFTLSLENGERQQITFRRFDTMFADWANGERYLAYSGFTDSTGNSNIYLLDLQRGLTVMPIRNPDRDMYPNWGP